MVLVRDTMPTCRTHGNPLGTGVFSSVQRLTLSYKSGRELHGSIVSVATGGTSYDSYDSMIVRIVPTIGNVEWPSTKFVRRRNLAGIHKYTKELRRLRFIKSRKYYFSTTNAPIFWKFCKHLDMNNAVNMVL